MIDTDKLCVETLTQWLLKTRDNRWDDKEYGLTRLNEGYDIDTMIHIYESRVDMYACSIEHDILECLKEMVE